jgi:3-methyladenine DNA glycosylase AlkC
MAESLKQQYGPAVPRQIAKMIGAAWPAFDQKHFLSEALLGYEQLELMPRARQIAKALHSSLPIDFNQAVQIIGASLGPKLESTGKWGMAPFLYLPHVFYVASVGLPYFEESMRLQYELTQRFTAEFSIRSFIEKYPAATLSRLEEWAQDSSVHVRRLVSEGTRPRLPWAQRLKKFQNDPRPIMPLLKQLRDDPELYVRRSVANNLNDIGKDNPEFLIETLRDWKQLGWQHGEWITRHALRTAVKRGEKGALKLLGVGAAPGVKLAQKRLTPRKVKIGETLKIEFTLRSTKRSAQQLMVDLQIDFVKASGKSSPKVFKMRNIELPAGKSVMLGKTISFRPMTTRKLYPGVHNVHVILNGRRFAIGRVTVVPSSQRR